MIDLLAFQIGSTPLFHACLRGHVKVAKRLLEDPRTCLSLLKVYTQCLKILQKVSFDVASKASYVYNLGGQAKVKNVKIDEKCQN